MTLIRTLVPVLALIGIVALASPRPVTAGAASSDWVETEQTAVRLISASETTGGGPVLTLSRQSRWDSVASAITGTLGSRFIHLLRDEWALITLAPSGASEAMASVSVRVSTDGEPDTCQLAMRFEDGLRALDCTAGTATLTGAVTPTAGDGPEVYYGGSAYFDDGSGITLEGQRMDYSGDFTVQGWVQVDRVDATFTDIYRDHSAAPGPGGGPPVTAGAP